MIALFGVVRSYPTALGNFERLFIIIFRQALLVRAIRHFLSIIDTFLVVCAPKPNHTVAILGKMSYPVSRYMF